MSDENGLDDKIICVHCEDPNWSHMERLEDLPQQLCSEISHFFSIYKQPEGHEVEVEGWRPREDALAVIEAAQERFRAQS